MRYWLSISLSRTAIWPSALTTKLCGCPDAIETGINLNQYSRRYDIAVRTLKVEHPAFEDLNVVSGHIFSLQWYFVNVTNPVGVAGDVRCHYKLAFPRPAERVCSLEPLHIVLQAHCPCSDLRKLGLNLVPFPRVSPMLRVTEHCRPYCL